MIVVYNSLRSKGPLTTNPPISGVKTTFLVLDNIKSPSLGIEIIVYTLVYEKHIEKLVYISKADTTGLFPSHASTKTAAILEWVLSLSPASLLDSLSSVEYRRNNDESCLQELPNGKFLSHTHFGLYVLLQRHRGRSLYGLPQLDIKKNEISLPETVKTKVVLFTRPEPQYLFPNSNLNKGKHLLDGPGLLKWWLKVIEGLQVHFESKFIDIVGADTNEVQRFIPSKSEWQIGNIFSNSKKDSRAVDCIPLLPDDPKGRFLEHLVVENRILKITLDQFWTELSARQEFRLGITVGLLGFEISEPRSKWHDLSNTQKLSKKVFAHYKNVIMDKNYHQEGDWDSLDRELCQIMKTDLLPVLDLEIKKRLPPNQVEAKPSLDTVNTLQPRSKKRKSN